MAYVNLVRRFRASSSWFVLAICLAASSFSHAYEPILRERVFGALKSGDFKLLEHTYSVAQQDFEQNRQSDKKVGEAYHVIGDLHRQLDQATAGSRLDEWVKQFPHSYAAKTVRGIYLADRALQARGGKFVNATPDEQFAEMRKWHDLAKRDLLASLKLTRYPLISHIELYGIAMVGSNDRAKSDAFSKAFEIAPASMELHKQVVVSLTPRWGGSYALMEAYIDKVGQGLSSANDRGILKSMIIEDKASLLSSQKKYEEAYALLGEAIKLRDSTYYLCQRVYLGTLLKKPAATILNDLKAAVVKDMPNKYCAAMAAGFAKVNPGLADSIPLLDAYIKHFPRNADLYNTRAWIYQEREDKVAAFPDLLQSAELGDAWGQTLAGKYLFSGWGGTVDRVKALGFLKAAAEQGDREAQFSVVQALEYLGKPDEAQLAKKRYAAMRNR